ncbi:hypothetical protein EI94DRAFT_1711217 [Lactarius quietus]|nr:hypothetical protein EI94DRAFT_1711217 [Lactarius quietus]
MVKFGSVRLFAIFGRTPNLTSGSLTVATAAIAIANGVHSWGCGSGAHLSQFLVIFDGKLMATQSRCMACCYRTMRLLVTAWQTGPLLATGEGNARLRPGDSNVKWSAEALLPARIFAPPVACLPSMNSESQYGTGSCTKCALDKLKHAMRTPRRSPNFEVNQIVIRNLAKKTNPGLGGGAVPHSR